MTSTVTQFRPTVRPLLIGIGAFVVAVVLAIVLAVSAWTSGSNVDKGNPSPPATVWMCDGPGPC